MGSLIRIIAATAIALILAAFPAAASSTICMFYAPPGAPVPDLEFLGYEDLGGILIADKDGPRSLPASTYKALVLDQYTKRIHLIYTNPGDPSLPPSFTLEGEGRHVRLMVIGGDYTGRFECGQW